MKVLLSSTAQDLVAYRQVADDTTLRLSQEAVIFSPPATRRLPLARLRRDCCTPFVWVWVAPHRASRHTGANPSGLA